MGGPEDGAVMRMLTRHQWVREHGTPRVTTLVGDPAIAQTWWHDWLRASQGEASLATTFAPPRDATDTWLSTAAIDAIKISTQRPRQPVAVIATAPMLARWLASRTDRVAVIIAEGVVELPLDGRSEAATTHSPPPSAAAPRARSRPEAKLFTALEATPATTGRFQLNQTLSFHFGPRPVEVDLLARADDLAIEVDGYHHFTDVDHYRLDREKDLLLQAHGYIVLRVLADDVDADARQAVQMVIRLLGIRDGARRRRKG
ncbi:MAG: DUF559 domain-containing protein [Myxococcales bacterium]|nr:DUF559 domain-containing protein [Myxococcales bacterium]